MLNCLENSSERLLREFRGILLLISEGNSECFHCLVSVEVFAWGEKLLWAELKGGATLDA